MKTDTALSSMRLWRVVIIEDSLEDRDDIRRLLLKGSDRHYRFIEAETGAAGLHRVLDTSDGPPDCVVLDYALPDMDAVEVLAGMTGADGLTVCPVVVLTGAAEARLGTAVLRAGAQDFIGKSWMTALGLTRAVENAAERWAMTRELKARTVALQASEAQLQLAVEVAGLGVNRIDYHSGTVVLDPIAAALFGLAAGVALPRSAIHATFHPQDKDEIVRRMDQSLDPTGQGTFSMDHRVVHLDGSVHWLSVKKLVTFAETQGIRGPVSSVLVAMDITDRKVREEQLRKSEEFNRSLMDGTADCVKVLDLDGRLLHMNTPGLCAMEIDDLESVCGQEWEALWPADARCDIERSVTNALRGEVSSFQAYCPTAKGTPKWWEVTVSPVRDAEGGRVVRLLAMSHDVTERRRAEANEREMQEQVVSTLESISDGFMRFDRDWRIIYLNAEAERINQRSRSDTIGRTLWDLFPDIVGTALETEYRRAVADQVTVEFENRYEPWGRWYAVKGYPAADGGLTVYYTDITERKRSEAELERVTVLLDTLLRTAPIGFCFFDRELRYQRVNECLAQINGVTAEAHIGRHVSEIVPAMAESVRDITNRILATGQPVLNFEHCGETPAAPGVMRFWNANWYPVHDSAGEVEGFGLTVEEITARKKAQGTIARQVRELDTLYATTPAGLFQIDTELRFVRVNTWMAAINGRSIEAHIGRTVREVFNTELANLVERLHRQVIQTGQSMLELELHGTTAASTEERYWLVSYHPVNRADGEVVGLHGVVVDITERKQAEQLLLRSEQRMRLATEANAVGIWEWNVITGEVHWDALMFRLYGIAPTADGLVPYTLWRGALMAEDLAESERILADTLRRCGQSRREFRILRRDDGECRVIEGVETVRMNEHGQAQWVVGTNLDITDRKRAEEKLRQLAADLSDADHRKNEFLATLAHELRNPLAPIRNGLQLMKLARGEPTTIEQARSMMERQLTQLVRLVDDLMDVSRINLDKLELRKERLPLATVVNSAVETSRPSIGEMGHELTVTIPEQPLMVDADMTRLAQVFMNLLNNAAKYSDRGGHIRLNVELEGSDAVVTVTDTGIGIDADQLPRIFGMFSQISGTLERSQGGLGIGLTLVKRLVELHGGSVEARSEGLGLGSEFIVRLPVFVDASPPQASSVDDEAEAVKSSLRILIVDDNRDAADSLSEMLKMMGYDTCTAYDGQQGVDAAGEYRPDVILLDIGLPRLNGYEACRLIREQPKGEGVVMIALTGWGQDGDRRRSREAGFDHHLVKPVDPQALLKMLAGFDVGAEKQRPERAS